VWCSRLVGFKWRILCVLEADILAPHVSHSRPRVGEKPLDGSTIVITWAKEGETPDDVNFIEAMSFVYRDVGVCESGCKFPCIRRATRSANFLPPRPISAHVRIPA
jgi:hypothetical protein